MQEMLVVLGNRENLFNVTPEKKFGKLYSRRQGNRRGTPAREIETSFLQSVKKTQETTQSPMLIGDYLPTVRWSGSGANYKCKIYKCTMMYQSNTTKLYYVYYCIRATCFVSYRIIFRPFYDTNPYLAIFKIRCGTPNAYIQQNILNIAN